jgi:hypothetical protein
MSICECSWVAEGLSSSNTPALRYFHNIQAINNVADARLLCMGFGVICLAANHHSCREDSCPRGQHVICSPERASCHTCLEKAVASVAGVARVFASIYTIKMCLRKIAKATTSGTSAFA